MIRELWSDFLYRLRAIFRRDVLEQDLEYELRFHIKREAEKYIAQGMAPDEAMRRARVAFGGLDQIKEDTRDARGTRMIEQSRRDVVLALRSLRRTPAFTTTVILILGLAIGMTSAMLKVFEAVLLRKLPIADQDRVVRLVGADRATPGVEVPVTLESFRRFRDETRTLSGVAGYAHWGTYAPAIRDGDRTLVLRQAAVTGNFFQVLGATPALGRLFGPGDGRPWGPQDENTGNYNIVLSYGTWQRVFGGNPDILGRRLQTPRVPWNPVIVGVAPPGLDFPRGADYWMPANYSLLNLIGRLSLGSTAEGARIEYSNFLSTDPAARGPQTPITAVQPLAEAIVGDVRPALVALTAAVGLLLLLACVNIANLVVLRSAGRAHDRAIRRALGAGSLTLVRESFAESALLAVAGGLVGLWLAQLLVGALLFLAPDALPRSDLIVEGGAPLAVAAGVTMLALLLFGLLPAIGSLGFGRQLPLRADALSGMEGRRLRQLRRGLVAAQIALALVVLAGAGLLVRSFARLAGLDFGYSTEQLSLLSVTPPYNRYIQQCGGPPPATDSVATARIGRCMQERRFALHDQVEERLSALPEVVSISSTLLPPFLGPSVWMTKVVADRQTETEAADNPWFGIDGVGLDYFRTFGLPILRGRPFTSADRDGSPPVAIVSEGVARTLWPGEDPVGRRFGAPGAPPDSQVTVVGVVPDVHYREHRKHTPRIYRPYRQIFAQGIFAIRTRGPLSSALPGIRGALREIDPEVVVTKAERMDELIAPQLAQPRLHALLLSTFAFAALVLAAIGLYGIMAQLVAQRRRELGVRMALGATAGQLRQMVLRQAATITLLGALAGLTGALTGARLLTSLLFEVTPTDPLTLMGVSILLFAVALLACYVPARRVSRINPAVALRAE